MVNVTGTLGTITQVAPEHQSQLTDSKCTVDDVSDLMNKFVQTAQSDQHRQAGFSNSALGMSKLGQIAVGRIHARDLAGRNVSRMKKTHLNNS